MQSPWHEKAEALAVALRLPVATVQRALLEVGVTPHMVFRDKAVETLELRASRYHGHPVCVVQGTDIKFVEGPPEKDETGELHVAVLASEFKRTEAEAETAELL